VPLVVRVSRDAAEMTSRAEQPRKGPAPVTAHSRGDVARAWSHARKGAWSLAPVRAGRLSTAALGLAAPPQRDVDERRAFAHPHDGRPGSYLQWAEKNERVVGPADGGAIAAASEDWRRAVDEHRIANAVLIERDNHTRAAAHTAAREQLRTQGSSATRSTTDRSPTRSATRSSGVATTTSPAST
jgi:hypothetical protein